MNMNIGILGSGGVAKSLAAGFLAHGHKTMVGTRNPAKLKEWAAENPKSGIGSFAEAARFGELVVLAVKGTASADALRAADIANLAGKVVIDIGRSSPCAFSGASPASCVRTGSTRSNC
jgi:predicted dinucleotide-binding enzyme